MNISFDRQQHTTQMRPADNPMAKAITDKISKLLLQDIKIGDLFEVEIIDSLQKQIKVMLADGTIFEAKLDQPLDLNIGQQVVFGVKDIIGKQVVMELAPGPIQDQQEGDAGIQNILKQLDIPLTQDSVDIVKHLMQKMLPITKDNIKQMEFGLKSSQIPLDSLLSMLENEIPVTPSTLKQVEAYESGEIKLQGQLEAMVDNIIASDDGQFIEQVHKLLNSAKEEISQIQDKQIKDIPIKDNPPIKEDQIKDSPARIDQNPETKSLEILKKEISEIFKETFFIDPTKLKAGAETKLNHINVVYKEIYKFADRLEKLEEKALNKAEIKAEEGLKEKPTDKAKTELFLDIKSNIEFLTIANKYDTMLHIPLLIQNQFKHGELYIFNKKKKNKKGYNEASMLISLETVSLGTIETFIKKHNKQISVQFKTDNEEIESVIKGKIQLLKGRLKDKGYDLISASYIPNTQPFSVKNEVVSETSGARYRFDTKA